MSDACAMKIDRLPAVVALAVLLALCILTPLAYASPPDPSWIRGIYDGADYDEVVGQITSEGGLLPPFLLAVASPLIVLVGPALQCSSGLLPFLSFRRLKPRAPPAF